MLYAVPSELKISPPERRSSRRYHVALSVHYQAISGGTGLSGRGKTVNISSTGILVTSDQVLSPGILLKVELEWPVAREHMPLNLEIAGQVVRSVDSPQTMVGIKILRHEFRAAVGGGAEAESP